MIRCYAPPIQKPRKPKRLSDSDRSQWIDSDEGLYRWWRQSGKREFIRRNRTGISAAIERIRDVKPL